MNNYNNEYQLSFNFDSFTLSFPARLSLLSPSPRFLSSLILTVNWCLIQLGKLICQTCLPIKCLEAVIVALFLLLPYSSVCRAIRIVFGFLGVLKIKQTNKQINWRNEENASIYADDYLFCCLPHSGEPNSDELQIEMRWTSLPTYCIRGWNRRKVRCSRFVPAPTAYVQTMWICLTFWSHSGETVIYILITGHFIKPDIGVASFYLLINNYD